MNSTRRILNLAVLGLSLAAVCATPLAAETQWGTSHLVTKTVNAWNFTGAASDITWSIANNMYRYGTNTGYFYAGLDVPDGALIVSIELDACDSTTFGSVRGALRRSSSSGFDDLAEVETGMIQAPGCGRFLLALPAPETVDNDTYTYTMVAITGTTAQTVFGSIRVHYQLQVSPPPPAPTFNDVPASDPGFQYIEALVASGITVGCGGDNYCPDGTLTRRQMAVFLAKALGLNWPQVLNLRGGAPR